MPLGFDPIEEAGRNWQKAGWDGVDAMKAATSLTRAQQIVQSRIDRALASLGLNFSRFEVLALLSFSRAGELPMGKIGDRLQVHAASVTNTIQHLEAAGFVERVAHPDDGRAVLARLLPAGRRAAAEAAAALGAIDFGMRGLSPASWRRVHAEVADLREANGDFS